jgi:hypothetical protein
MLSFELLQAITELRRNIDPAGYLGQVLNVLSSQQKELIKRLADTLQKGTSDESWKSIQGVFQQTNLIIKTVREIKHKALFSELTRTEEAIAKFSNVTGSEYMKTGFIPAIEEFSSAYENIVSSYSNAHTLEFSIALKTLHQVMLNTVATLDSIAESLGSDEEYDIDNRAELSLVLHPEMEVSKVAIKLNALAIIYVESCELLKVSYSEYPFHIAKMESGSLWLKLFGHNRVVSFILSLVERGIGYFHRNYTREGKIESIPKKIEIINEVLGLKNRLVDEGIDTSEMEENITKSGIKIAEQLNQLLGGEAVVTVNRVTYSVGKEVEKKYIEESRQLLLESPRNAEDSSSGEPVSGEDVER